MIILINTQDDVTLNVSNSKIIIYENKASYVDMKYDIAYKSNCTHQPINYDQIFFQLIYGRGPNIFHLIILIYGI